MPWVAGAGDLASLRLTGRELPTTPSHCAWRDRSQIHYQWLGNLAQVFNVGAFFFMGFPKQSSARKRIASSSGCRIGF